MLIAKWPLSEFLYNSGILSVVIKCVDTAAQRNGGAAYISTLDMYHTKKNKLSEILHVKH